MYHAILYFMSTSPLKDLRTERNIPLDVVAFEANVSPHAVMRMEQLCYPSPLPSVITALSDITGVSESDLVTSYATAVAFNRREASHAFNSFGVDQLKRLTRNLGIDAPPWTRKEPSPFYTWRSLVFGEMSQIKFSSHISVHPATLSKYESDGGKFPHSLANIFGEMGLDPDVLYLLKTLSGFNSKAI